MPTADNSTSKCRCSLTALIRRAVVYYLTRLHQQQMHEGDDYQRIAASYSLSFLDHVLYSGKARWHWCFHLRDAEEPAVIFSDQLAIHIVELPKFQQAVTELATPFDRWCFFLRHAEELDKDHLPQPLQWPPIRKAMEVLQMFTQNDLERERYEARLKFRRDQNAMLRDARLEGEERGTLLGRIQERQEFLGMEATPQEILRAMTLEQLQELVDELGKKMAKRA